MKKVIEIDGRQVCFRATAAVPRLYRIKFGRDILQDMQQLSKAYARAAKGEEFGVPDLEVFENCAYIMARHGDPDKVPDTVEEWLDSFQTFSIYQVLPQLLELWCLGAQSQVNSKKKSRKAAGK